ncbi:carboxylesterase/lipase family protein [Variovorax sp. ZT4R33]|uniref:carboxylesterase/lipase family protein n=1 Tax=Variovorax sp. ZT4R33 TaxID=3443743 RepID=UPI003F44559F
MKAKHPILPGFRHWAPALFTAGLAVACGGGSDAHYDAGNDIVAVTGGSVAAAPESSASTRVFKAIPFAAPPVGALRWAAPAPVVAWTGVRRSDAFSPACHQGNRPAGQPGSLLYQPIDAQSEDCLYLNVWTGAGRATEKRPVMVLLYGGGYQLGAGSQANYNGTGLADKGAVVVTLNYRVGPLGFLAHPALSAESTEKVSGNYALLDAIAALKWVQANVAGFGGDPSNVTLYSESAGSGMASVLLGSPHADKLFHKLVIESFANLPAGASNTTLVQAEAAGSIFAANLGAADLAALRAKTPQQIMAGTGSFVGTIVDGVVAPDQLDRLLVQGKTHDVPLLVGWNADEGTPYAPFATTLAGYNNAASARYGSFADQFKAVYPVSSDADVLAMAYAPLRDNLFAWQPWTLARAHAAQRKAKTFLYHFNRRPAYYPTQKFNEQDPPAKFGAYHSLEQVYFYNNLDRGLPARPYDVTDRRIADAASSYLVNFARSGNPNGDGLVAWPEFIGPSSPALFIGDSIAPGPVPSRPALDFFDAFYTQALGRPLPF